MSDKSLKPHSSDQDKSKTSSLQQEISWQQQKTNDYKKKCLVVRKTTRAVNLQAQKVNRELSEYSQQMQNNMKNLKRNKDGVLKAIDVTTRAKTLGDYLHDIYAALMASFYPTPR